MTNPESLPLDDDVIDIRPPATRHWRRWLILAIVVLFFALSPLLSVYIEALWFGSLGYASVYWYTWRLEATLFIVFALLTALILRSSFWLLERNFVNTALERRTIIINNQPVTVSPARIVRPIAWIASILFGLGYGLAMAESWPDWALYLHQANTSLSDPIFGKPLGFYLFTLPIYQLLASWLTVLAIVVLIAALLHTLLAAPQKFSVSNQSWPASKPAYKAVSIALAALLMLIACRVYLTRFTYLWDDHQTFSGVTYTEANYLLPGLLIVAVALIIAALVALFNALVKRSLSFLIAALAFPILVFIVAGLLVPAYVQSFIVKPNELGRETPYIENNITWTRRAYNIENIEVRNFDAQTISDASTLTAHPGTLDNIRLWDWHALQDTLRQIQEIRTYYDFPDVDVDRYRVAGETRQMMLAAREMDVNKLPTASRNWINEKLIYTHGYGVTMNPVNGFTTEGMPSFVLSNMPVEASAPDIKVTRPEIYFGQKTDTDVYVKTKEQEFNYPQGEENNYTTYEGTGGIPIGGTFRRFMLAWGLGDLSKLPFSDRVTPESRVLMRRNIRARVESLAPFLIYDNDPYIVVADDGRLYWMMDAFTASDRYPYSRNYTVQDQPVNYVRNSVKVTIDAYDGAVNFYIFDSTDPLIQTYRAIFPALFRDANQMPVALRAHVRYPEALIRTQGEVFGLYHTQNPKVFFQREDVWSVARQMADKKQEPQPMDPYFALMQLPGEEADHEFVEILPFTPASRNNMIGWIAGRSDGAAYGSLLVYNFPKSRLIDGPLQIEARIDQNAQLSSQLTLWNQQGSRVLRGNLLVIPIGNGLLYVEPIYLQAENSPMPELRLVVLATEDKLGFGSNFVEATGSLFGAGRGIAEQRKTVEMKTEKTAEPNKSAAAPIQAEGDLIKQAADDLEQYQRLTSEGKLGEAGQKLESLKRTLEELKKQQQK